MRRSTIQYVDMGKVLLPPDLADEIRLLLRDPVSGKTRHGELKALWVRLAANWVNSRRDTQALLSPEELETFKHSLEI